MAKWGQLGSAAQTQVRYHGSRDGEAFEEATVGGERPNIVGKGVKKIGELKLWIWSGLIYIFIGRAVGLLRGTRLLPVR